jgi:UDP-N-acetylmuramoyl-tripeptide--D-alanyl-D-alanine ligase
MNSTALWNGFNLITALGARISGSMADGVAGISIDTRSLAQGDLFLAIKGETSDGHDYVRQAFEKGAAACVIDEQHADKLKSSGPLFVVRDVFASMESLGRAGRARSKAGITAVTGSVGKTSTKEMLKVALSQFDETHAAAASFNNHIGVPLTLARMPVSARFGVFEVGMNHAGEIDALVRMVKPHVAIITTIAPVHLENLGSIEAIADAKAEIFGGLEPHGVAIVHRDIDQYERLRAAAKSSNAGQILCFGAQEHSDARLISVEPDGEGSLVEAWVLGTQLRYKIGAPGRHIAMNSLAVLLAGRALGLDVADVAASLREFRPPPGRGARISVNTRDGAFTLIDESYNANPASMRAALSLLGATQPAEGGRRIAVLGDMLELGPTGADLHRDLDEAVAANRVDLLFAAGPLTKSLYDAVDTKTRAAWAPTSAGIRDALLAEVRAGDVVMIKGSNGSRMGPLVKALQEHHEKAEAEHATQD